MSQKLNELLALAQQEAQESGIDLNEAVVGGGGRLLPEGYAFAQLVEYIEYGNQPQEYAGKAKDPVLEFTLGFALTGAGYQNDDGTPYVIRTYATALHRNDKARAFKLFKLLNWKGTAKSYGQLLGEMFLVKIKHTPKSKTDTTVVSRLDLDSFLPPLDPISKQPYPIAQAPDSMYRLFLWNKPTKAAWDSLYVDGMYEAKDGKPAASKNRIQETILGALDFQGSPLQALLAGAGVPTALPTTLTPQAAVLASGGVVAPLQAVAPPGVAPQAVQAPFAVAVPVVAPVPGSVPATVATQVPQTAFVEPVVIPQGAAGVVSPVVPQLQPIAVPAVVPPVLPA